MPEADLIDLFVGPLNRIGLRYMISGSVAATAYGEPRLTNDIDIIAVVDRQSVARILSAFSPSEFYCPPAEVIFIEAARDFRGHFNIIHHETGFKADVYLAGRDPLHAWGFERARTIQLGGLSIVLAPPEYVIIRKLEFFREGGSEKHIRDIAAILRSAAANVSIPDLQKLVTERGLHEAWHRARNEANEDTVEP